MGADREAIYAELLALRCKRGDRQAFAELVAHWEGRLYYYVRRLVGKEEDAWDVLQQTWMAVFRGIARLKDARSLPAWLYRVARNTAYSHLRASSREHAHLDDPGDVSAIEASDDNFTAEDAEQVHHAMDRISLPHKEALTLFLLEDLTMEQMADVLGIPLGTVKSRLYHAKRALRAVLEQEEGQ